MTNPTSRLWRLDPPLHSADGLGRRKCGQHGQVTKIQPLPPIRAPTSDPLRHARTSADAWAMAQPVIGGVRGPGTVQTAHLIMLRTDVELGVNTTSLYKPASGPGSQGAGSSNPCGAFAVGMMPAGTAAGVTAGQLTAQQNASCPRRTSPPWPTSSATTASGTETSVSRGRSSRATATRPAASAQSTAA